MKTTLVVLAAGLGSRYGSLKQIDQFGPSGETIIDYSIYDAIRAGFSKVVFIIRKDIEEEFKEVFVGKYGNKIEVAYVFQEIDNVPEGIIVPQDRIKPWGTGHAVLVAAERVDSPFAVINADDFYGATSFQLLHDQLIKMDPSQLNACLIGYRLKNTLSDHGYVSRGVCRLSENNTLEEVVERTHISRDNTRIYFEEDNQQHELTGEELVSMNLVGFTPLFFNVLKDGFTAFVNQGNLNPKAEYFLPGALDQMIKEQGVQVPVIETPEMSYGVTYKEDKSLVVKMINDRIKGGMYPKKLW